MEEVLSLSVCRHDVRDDNDDDEIILFHLNSRISVDGEVVATLHTRKVLSSIVLCEMERSDVVSFVDASI